MKAADLLSLIGGFLIPTATWVAQNHGAPAIQGMFSLRLRLANVFAFAVLLVGWHLSFRLLGLYRLDRPVLGYGRLPVAMVAVACSAALLGVVAEIAGFELVDSRHLALFAVSSACLVGLSRTLLAWARSGIGGVALQRRRALIAGSGPRARRLARQLERDSDSPVEIVGYADEQGHRANALPEPDIPLVCDLTDLRSYLREQVVDELFIALPMRVLHRVRDDVLAACREYGVTVRYPVSALVDVTESPSRTGEPDDDIILSLYCGVIGGWPLLGKRAFDLALGIPLSALALPIVALAAIAIKLESRGPVFFTQDRVGLNKRIFRIYKLRTMVAGAEQQIETLEPMNEVPGPTFKLTRDPRVTRLGRLLRSTSIDELPQLINVLRGEMSLVGPRPLSVRDVRRFSNDAHRRRFSVLPGLTGLWQVSGRSSVQFDRWMQLDLQYIDQWSLVLDLKLLLKTIPAVLLRTGAK